MSFKIPPVVLSRTTGNKAEALYLLLLKFLLILSAIHGNKSTNMYESEKFEFQFQQMFPS